MGIGGSQHGQCPTGFTGDGSWNSQVSWTGRDRIRCLWYRFRPTISEMNYATRRMVELQTRRHDNRQRARPAMTAETRWHAAGKSRAHIALLCGSRRRQSQRAGAAHIGGYSRLGQTNRYRGA
jgi:hypothetical protein